MGGGRDALCVVLALALASTSTATLIDTSGWLGAEYTPSGASNNLWWHWYPSYVQQIDRELAAAAAHLRVNTLRMFLHSLLWESDPGGLLNSVHSFLDQAASHGMGVGLVRASAHAACTKPNHW